MVYSADKNSLENQVIKMDNMLVQKSTKFNAEQQKLFYVCLASLNKGVNKQNEVEIDKEELFNYLGLTDSDRWYRIRGQFKQLLQKSYVQFGTDEEFDDGFLITRTRSTRKKIYVAFEPYFLPLLLELSSNYTKLLDDDVIDFNSKFSMALYQQLMRLNCYSSNVQFTTKQLKDFFGLTKDDYVYKGHFNRALFETKTVDLAVKEINEKCKCIRDLSYTKLYKGRQVAAYKFTYVYYDPEQEKNSLKDEKINENQMSLFDEEIKSLKWWKKDENTEHET